MTINPAHRLFEAIERDDYEYIRRNFSIFQSCLKDESKGKTPIECAVDQCRFKILKFIAKRYADLRPAKAPQTNMSAARQNANTKKQEALQQGKTEQSLVFDTIAMWLYAHEWFLHLNLPGSVAPLPQICGQIFQSALTTEHTKLFELCINKGWLPNCITNEAMLIQYLADNGCLKLVRYLAKMNKLQNIIDCIEQLQTKMAALKQQEQMALLQRYEKVNILLGAYAWQNFLKTSALLTPEVLKRAFKAAADADFKPLFSNLLKLGAWPENDILQTQQPRIRKLLSYAPSKRAAGLPTIAHCIQQRWPAVCSLVDDEEMSSDEESSDDEEDTLQVSDQNTLASVDSTRLLFRGVHYCPNYFDGKRRKDMRARDKHFEAVYSLATLDLMAKLGQGNPDSRSEADQMIKHYFTFLKFTPDKPEFETDTNRSPPRKKEGENARFPNLFDRFVQAYVTTYGKLFNNGGMRRNFNFYADENPLLSTSKSHVSASHFAGGRFITEEARYYPKVRKSTGVLKHRRLGYLEVYCLDQAYWDKHAIDVFDLIQRKVIGVDAHHKHASEVAIMSSIPKSSVIGYQIISLPSMRGDWSGEIAARYGLNQTSYLKFQVLLRDKDRQTSALQELIEKVVEFQASRLKQNLDKMITDARDRVLVEKMASTTLSDQSAVEKK